MPQKKITELQLRSGVTSDLNLPSDDGLQSYRVTAEQMKAFVLATGNVSTAALADASVTRIKGAVDLFNLPVLTITSAHTAVDANELILCNASSGAFAVTLPSPVGRTGKRYFIKKTDTTFNAITVTGTIDGFINRKLSTYNEHIQIVCDGVIWQIVGRRFLAEYTSYTPTLGIVGGSATTAAYWRRDGDSLIVRFKVNHAGTPTSGLLTLTIPTGLVIDTAKLGGGINNLVGSGLMLDTGAVNYNIGLIVSTTTVISALSLDASLATLRTGTATSFNVPFAIGTGDAYLGEFRVPIVDWEG